MVPLHLQIEQAQADPVTSSTVLTRGVASVMPQDKIQTLMDQRPIRVYLGIDPTSPNLHIGHMVPLRKLRQLQLLGHQVFLLFGTFTGMIGDPTDKSATRVRLTQEQVAANVATYRDQAGRILDLAPDAENPIQVVYNHEWLQGLSFADVVELASNFTVNQFVARDTYKRRLESGEPLYLHELLYPLMQGYDSVALQVDLEVGGKDQIPNMLAGTHLLQRLEGMEKTVLGLKLIEDPSGAKMGKTTGNVVNIMEWSEVVYEALMTWPDSTIALGLELLTDVPMSIVKAVETEMSRIAQNESQENPVRIKEAFAWRVVAELNGVDEADYARGVFDAVKRQKQLPPRVQEFVFDTSTPLSTVLHESKLAANLGEAQALITSGAVRVNRQPQKQDRPLKAGDHIVELGKNSVKNVRKVSIHW